MGNFSDCSDPGIVRLAAQAAKDLLHRCRTAIVVLTSTCTMDGHGNHVTAAVMNKAGTMTPSEARAACKRLRELADELEQRFAYKDLEN